MKDRLKDPYFIVGVISTFFLAADIDFQTLTSWNLFFDAVMSIVNNPVTIAACVCSIYSHIKGQSKKRINKIKDLNE